MKILVLPTHLKIHEVAAKLHKLEHLHKIS